MSAGICPYLERRVEEGRGRFYCRARGGAPASPGLEPCLLAPTERAQLCPDYAKAARAERLA
jgi:hypothetical protein